MGPAQVVEFKHESDEISLDIPIKGITPSSVPGCRITPLTRPTVSVNTQCSAYITITNSIHNI